MGSFISDYNGDNVVYWISLHSLIPRYNVGQSEIDCVRACRSHTDIIWLSSFDFVWSQHIEWATLSLVSRLLSTITVDLECLYQFLTVNESWIYTKHHAERWVFRISWRQRWYCWICRPENSWLLFNTHKFRPKD